MHTSMCMKYPLLFPSLSLSLRCAIFHEMVVDKQRRYEISIVPAIKNDNITVIAWMYVTLYYRTAVQLCIPSVLYGAKTWLPKKEFFECCDLYLYVCHHITEHATIDANESAVFAKDDNEEDDDWKTGPQFFKKVEAPAPLIQPTAVLVASYTICCCCLLKE